MVLELIVGEVRVRIRGRRIRLLLERGGRCESDKKRTATTKIRATKRES